jgi:hypothetical protein
MTNPGTDAELRELISQIQAGLDEAARTVDTIVAGINSVLAQLPDVVIGGIRDGVAALYALLQDQLDRMSEILAYAGDSGALRLAGSAWANELGGTASRLAGFATLNSVQSDNHWSGRGADAYRDMLIPQKEALAAVKLTGDDIDDALGELAGGITAFWFSIGAATITLVVALAVATPMAATVVGAPAAAGFGGAAWNIFAAAVTAAITSLTIITVNAAANSAALDQRLSNDTAFPGGRWPRTADLGEASITDDDGTDWSLR